MIISASYKTDIPTFYGEWFMRRVRAGYCMSVNPYSGQVYRVALERAHVAGIVLWTKNVQPFLKHLPELKERGYPTVVQYTINRYPRALETSVVDAEKSVESAWRVRELLGARALVWRYDTIIHSSLTPGEFHLDNFRWLAGRLQGATDEVVISFAQLYRKTRRNLEAAAREVGFDWHDPPTEEKRRLLSGLLRIAREHGIRVSVCSQRDLIVDGAEDATCVDVHRLEGLAGGTIRARLKGNRKDCGCFESRDIGEYDTCPHGCVYCYAVQNRELALERFRQHDPDSEYLFAPAHRSSDGGSTRKGTLPLFGD
ncbi:MAG: DUF1848 domain-containing protein [Polyangiaceae bacterium]